MAKRPQKLSLNNIVEISSNGENPILQLRLTPTQSNFMYLYLSKINARKPETKQVIFSLSEYANIMNLQGRISTTRILNVTKSLYSLSYPTYDPDNDKVRLIHAFDNFELFKVGDDWHVTISCHQKAESHFFELSRYTEFEVWNVLALKSTIHRKMYEALKQHELIKFRELTLVELRKLLLLKPTELTRWSSFKRMLNGSKKALKENTDIFFEWEIISRRGKGGNVHKLRFDIYRNDEVIARHRQVPLPGMDEYLKREREVDEELYQEADKIQEDLKKFQDAIDVDYEQVNESDLASQVVDIFKGTISEADANKLISKSKELYGEDIADDFACKTIKEAYDSISDFSAIKSLVPYVSTIMRNQHEKNKTPPSHSKKLRALDVPDAVPAPDDISDMKKVLEYIKAQPDAQEIDESQKKQAVDALENSDYFKGGGE